MIEMIMIPSQTPDRAIGLPGALSIGPGRARRPLKSSLPYMRQI
jgi:hypothetical protein